MVNRSSVDERKSTVRSHQVLERSLLYDISKAMLFCGKLFDEKKLIVNRIEIALA